jgi:2-(1,2-epoxy-1,2-dihydrophenyl)acetyl-CoA isomerase
LAKSSEILLLDPVLDAEQAKQLGIVHEVFTSDELLPKVALITEKLANGATQSYAIAKMLLNQSLLPALEKQLDLERQGMINAGSSPDAHEGVEAFVTKRSPVFTGK